MYRTIYLLCPGNAATGGPEAVHQLFRKLKDRGLNAKIAYFPKMENPVHPRYESYAPEYVWDVDDSADNLLIVPESFLGKLDEFKNVRKAIWWLAISNGGKESALETKVKNSPVLLNLYRFGIRFAKPLLDWLYYFLRSRELNRQGTFD